MPIRISRFGFVNAYLVEEDDGLTLIDTTIAGGAKRILAAAQSLGKPIVRIALTHGHGDHAGQVDVLAAALPNVPVLLTARDARIVAGDKTTEPGEPASKIAGGWPVLESATQPIAPGDRVGSLEVHPAPGHTPGQVAFLDPRDGTLYCGDAYVSLGGVATSAKGTWRFPLTVGATWDKPTALETAKRLRALEPRALAPGHGKVVETPGTAMDAAIGRGL